MTPTKDDLVFYDGPPLFDLPDVPVFISVTFTWDRDRGKRLFREWRDCGRWEDVRMGGPGWGSPAREFIPGRFLKKGITITSRGCPKCCSWCVVPRVEGEPKELRIKPGNVIQDNNLLACSRSHVEKVFDMLMGQKAVQFKGGLDIDYLEPWHVEAFKKMRIKELWVACDNEAGLKRLDKAVDLFSDFSIEKKRCYVLLAHDKAETPAQAEKRCEAVLGKGFLPFAQLFQPAEWRNYPPAWKDVARNNSRPAIYRSKRYKCG